jgi:hypothetical protein
MMHVGTVNDIFKEKWPSHYCGAQWIFKNCTFLCNQQPNQETLQTPRSTLTMSPSREGPERVATILTFNSMYLGVYTVHILMHMALLAK